MSYEPHEYFVVLEKSHGRDSLVSTEQNCIVGTATIETGW